MIVARFFVDFLKTPKNGNAVNIAVRNGIVCTINLFVDQVK